MVIKDDSKDLSEINIIKTEVSEVQTCPKCGSIRIIEDHGADEIFCMECGCAVHQKDAGTGQELRAGDSEQKSECKMTDGPLTYTIYDRESSTIVDWHNRDVVDKNFLTGQKVQVYRLRNWQRRVRVSDSKERSLVFALSEITKISNNLNLAKNILETAVDIYRKAVKEQLISGRSIRDIAAAALYLACRQCGLPKTLDDVAQASTTNKKDVGKNYRFLVKELNYSAPPLQPNQYITKFSNQLSTQGKVEEIAHEILSVAKDVKLISGRGPIGIAATTSYVAAVLTGEHITPKEVARITKVAEATIKNRYKELENQLMIEISV